MVVQGERIQFGNNVNFVFETSDLRFASPATVSRMGMILMSDEDMDAGAIVKAWRAVHKDVYWSDDLFVQAYKLCMKAKGTAVPTTRVREPYCPTPVVVF
jgi:dynein heavy chain 2